MSKYYTSTNFIVADTEETEQNYMYGLRDSIPKELQGKLVIKVIKMLLLLYAEHIQIKQLVYPWNLRLLKKKMYRIFACAAEVINDVLCQKE